MKNRINVLSLLAAAILFTLPWIEIQCSQKPMITQSGAQLAYGGVSLSPELQQMTEMGGDSSAEDSSKGPGPAILIAIAAVFIILGLVAAIKQLRDSSESWCVPTIALIALACIIAQMAIGFPSTKDLEEELAQEQATPTAPEPPAVIEGSDSQIDVQFDLGAEMMAESLFSITVKYQFALYAELFALALPAILMFLIPSAKREEGDIHAAPTGTT